jgi:hypothetical protein
MYQNPRVNEELRFRMPLYYVCDGEIYSWIGDFDVHGGYVERGIDPETLLPYRVGPAAVHQEVTGWFTTDDWDEWFAENRTRNADDSSRRQKEIEFGLAPPDMHDQAKRTAELITVLAELDLAVYGVATGLASASSAAFRGVQIIPALERAKTVQATTQRAVQSGQLLKNMEIGARGEQIASHIFKNQGRFDQFLILKNASNNGFDIIARTHQGKNIYFEVKTSVTAKAPPLKGLQRAGADTFARTRLNEMANNLGRYKNLSPASANTARQLLEKAGNEPIIGTVVEITNLGQKTQSIAYRPWVQ